MLAPCARAAKRERSARVRASSPYLPNQRAIRDRLVRGCSVRREKALRIRCSDLVHSEFTDQIKKTEVPDLDIQQEEQAVMLERPVRRSRRDFPHTTNTNLLVHEDVEVCRITALDGEQSLFRSLPKNCIEKNPQFSGGFAESVVMLSCQTHCVTTLTRTWYVIHTSVWMACSHSDENASTTSPVSLGRIYHGCTHKCHC